MFAVGRKRTRDKHLPPRVYFRNGAYYFVDVKGKWHRLAKSYPDALIALAALLAKDAPTTTIELLWAKYQAEELGKKAVKTQKGRRQEMSFILKVFGQIRPEDIEPHHIWTYWRSRGEIEQGKHEIRALSALLTFGRQCGALCKPNPCYGLQLPSKGPRDHYVTDEAFLFVRDRAQPMIGYAMDLALLGGLDESTICSLERRHLTDEGIEYGRSKTGKVQLLEWSDELRLTVKAILAERPQLRRALICNRKGLPYSPNGFQSQWQRLMRRCRADGFKSHFHFHDLRAKSGSDAETDQEASDRLGHSSVELTRRVYRRLPRRSKPLRILDKPQ